MVVIINSIGNIGISEETLEKNFSKYKQNHCASLRFSSHFGINDSGKSSLIKGLLENNEISKKNFDNFSEIQNEIWGFETKTDEICLSFNGFNFSLDHFKRLKFLFKVSDSFFFHFNLNDIQEPSREWTQVVQFLFILCIENSTIKENNSKTINFIIHDSNSKKEIQEIKKEILQGAHEIWSKSLDYLGQKKSTPLKIEEILSFDFSFFPRKDLEEKEFSKEIEAFQEKTHQNQEQMMEKKENETTSISSKMLEEKIRKAWDESDRFLFLPLLNKEDEDIKGLINLYQTDALFNQLWEISSEVIKNWTNLVNRGKIVDNFGEIVSEFLSGLVLRFEKSLPHDFSDDERAIRKIQELSDMVRHHIISLFTRQILNLQTQALDKFKDLLLSIISDNKKDFEFEKKLVMEKIISWFEEKAGKIVVSEMQLTYQGAKKELQNVLIEFSEKFKESPVVKLNSMQKVEKKTSSSGLKQSGIVIGFGLTTAVRPSGFGNFQLVTSYSHGPHVFNFSLVNDRDVAEQEGQGKIKPIRIQPSLNFDIDL